MTVSLVHSRAEQQKIKLPGRQDEFVSSVADVLFGGADPGGRLPVALINRVQSTSARAARPTRSSKYVAFARAQSRYIITDERVKAELGFISSTTREFRISDIQGIDTRQSLIGSLLGIGDIEVRTADGAGIWWNGVPDHDDVAHTIRQHQRQYDETMGRK